MACITMLNKIGLSTDPWCTPTLTSKLSLSSPFLFDNCSNPLIQTCNHIYHPLFHSNMPQSPQQNLTRHPIEGLLQVYKSHPQLLLLAKLLFLNLPYNKNCIRCTFTRAKSKLHIIYLYSLSKPRLENSPTPLIHGQAILYLCKSCIQGRSPSPYTHSPSSFSNPPAPHRSSL